MRITLNIKNHQFLFWLGVAGVVFYVVAPVLFPAIPNLRQPELLPVYTLMMGLGQLLKGNALEAPAEITPPKEKIDEAENKPTTG